MAMKATEIRTSVVTPTEETLFKAFPEAVKIDKHAFAIPVEIEGKTYYAGIEITCKDFTGTKSRSPFSIETAVDKFLSEQQEAQAKAEEKAREKAQKEVERAAKAKAKAEK